MFGKRGVTILTQTMSIKI